MLPEYDPYKYISFPVYAANEFHTLMGVRRIALDDAGQRGCLAAMPRVVVFQSIVDSTVTAEASRPWLARALPPCRSLARGVRREQDRRRQGLIASGPLENLETIRIVTNLRFA